MIKKINFKKVLCIFVMAFSLLVVIACSKEVSTKYMWDNLVDAYNSKDLDKLSVLYYDSASAKSWAENNDESYFGGVEIVSKSYEEKSFSDLSTKVKVEKYYSAEVVCDIKVNGSSKEYKFDVFYLEGTSGLHFVSELNFIVVTEDEILAAEEELAVLKEEKQEIEDEKSAKEDLIYNDESLSQEEQEILVEELNKEYESKIEVAESKVEAKEAKIEKLKEIYTLPIGQVASDLWLKNAYYTNDNYIYQRSLAAEGTYDDERLYEIAVSSQLKNEKNVVIPSEIDGYKVTKIDDYAYYRITRLLTFTVKSSKMKTLLIPDTVNEIGKNAFYQCGKLEEINIPASVKKIGASAFASCVSAKKIVLNIDDNDMYLDENGEDYRLNVENQVVSTNASAVANKIVITGGFKQVYQGEIVTLTAYFEGLDASDDANSKLADIEWKAQVSGGGEVAGVQFEKTANSGVVNVILGISTSELGTSGKTIVISAHDKNNSINKATISMSVVTPKVQKSIDCTAFDRCNNLKEFVITSYNPYSISLSNGTQFSLSKDAIIYVPKGCVNKYKTSTIWAQYADQIKEME